MKKDLQEPKVQKQKSNLRITLGLKFAVIMGVTLIVVMLLLGIVIIKETKKALISDVKRKSQVYSTFLAGFGQQVMAQTAENRDLGLLQHYVDNLIENEDIIYAYITDRAGSPVVHSKKKRAPLEGTFVMSLPIMYENKKIGNVNMWYSTDSIVGDLSSNMQNVLIIIITLSVFVLGATMFVVSEKIIFKRIGSLINSMNKVKQGALDVEISDKTQDEIGLLGQNFNDMVREIEEKHRELTILFEMSRTVTSTLQVSLILDMVMDIVVDKLEVASSSVFILEEDGHLHIKSSRGLSAEFVQGDGFKVLSTFAQRSSDRGEMVVRNTFTDEDSKLKEVMHREGFKSLANIPLIISGKIMGLLNINSKQEDVFSERRIKLLSVFSKQLAVALQNAQLYERTQQFTQELEEKINIATGNLARTNDKLSAANERLEELSRAKSEFVSIVSHELRSPLTSVSGFVDLMLDGETGKINKNQKEFLAIIKDNSRRLLDLIGDLLNLSKIETGTINDIRKEPVDIKKIIKQVCLSFQAQLENKGLSLKMDIEKDLLSKVSADANQIIQVMTNLLSNAVKYTPKGGTVSVSLGRIPGYIQVMVSDTGMGIAKDDLSHMFEKFYRTDNPKVRELSGTGLGLTITKSIVEKHEGKIWVESELGKGTEFFFTLPVDKEESDAK
ncbi:MAG: ATP-binding protein [bacterium]